MKRFTILDLDYLTDDQKEKLRPMFSKDGYDEFLDILFEEKLKDLIKNKELVVFKSVWWDTKKRTWSIEKKLKKVANCLGYTFEKVGDCLVKFTPS
jgi:hypothetical protein